MKRLKKARILACAFTLIILLGLLHPLLVHGQEPSLAIKTLFDFACNSSGLICPDGEQPNSLIQSADGTFFGTAPYGGVGNQATGTVFKIDSSGQLTTLYNFVADQNGNSPNGGAPDSLVEGNDGFLYGAAAGGGANNAGVVFKLSKTGEIQILHNFCSLPNCGDFAGPENVLLGIDGALYGSTRDPFGSLFRITPDGSYTLLHSFDSVKEGPCCQALTLVSDGNTYGATVGGKTVNTTLFRITPAGQFTILHTFKSPDFPTSGPVEGADGKLYGISRRGVFVSSLTGVGFVERPISHTTSSDFLQFVTQASDLNLWSVFYKDITGPGALANISRKGSLLRTASFDGANGSEPDAPILQAGDGTLFGVTRIGGSVGEGQTPNGVIFSVNAGLPAPKPLFVSFTPNQGKVGSQVMIHGVHFVGATLVSFNGVKASFQVLNTGNILASVPAGATTGPIVVTNSGGTTASNTSFGVE